MIIDDERFDQKMYQRIIDRSGLVEETLSFHAADQALLFLRDNPDKPVDLILLDINMPRMSGFEFLAAATRDLGPNFTRVCIVMLTTSLDPLDREKAAQFAVVRDFLNKPLTVDDIKRLARLISETGGSA